MRMTNIANLLKQAAAENAGGLARVDAEYLLSHYLSKPRSWLYAHSDYQLKPEQEIDFKELVNRRQQGEPIAYIAGRRGFWTFDLLVTPDTLIPRPETELLVELAIECIDLNSASNVLDLGTGTGAIALAIAQERPKANVVAVDYSEPALIVARQNAAELNIRNIEIFHSNWFGGLQERRFDVIVSNPPYIEDADEHLLQGDLRFEPRTALASGADGLDDIRIIVSGAKAHLNSKAWLLIEHGWNQAEPIRQLFIDAGYVDVTTEQDLAKRDRVTMGRIR
jgi:release factor glutamine methyltransferase